MKTRFKPILFAFTACFIFACSDDSSTSANFDSATVCPAEGTNAYGMPNRGTFIDERDGQEYAYTTIGNQVWMAENLNYAGGICFNNDSTYCEKYGMLYNPYNGAAVDREKIESFCPNGWHVPDTLEWKTMLNQLGGTFKQKLENFYAVGYAVSGIESVSTKDICQFSVLTNGGHYSFTNEGSSKFGPFDLFLTSTVIDPYTMAYLLPTLTRRDAEIYFYMDGTYYSYIRCVKD